MSLFDLGILYAAAGVLSGLIARRRRGNQKRGLTSLALAVVLWPLWLPVLLATPDSSTVRLDPSSTRTEQCLLEGYEAVRGTALEPLLPREAVERLRAELRRGCARHAELRALLARPSFGVETAKSHVTRLSRAGASPRALASARLHLDNVERLSELCKKDEMALEELSELVSALRTQLVLARYAGSSPAGTADIVSELHARVEALGTTMDDYRPLLDT